MELTGPWSGNGKMRTWGWAGAFSIDFSGRRVCELVVESIDFCDDAFECELFISTVCSVLFTVCNG